MLRKDFISFLQLKKLRHGKNEMSDPYQIQTYNVPVTTSLSTD